MSAVSVTATPINPDKPPPSTYVPPARRYPAGPITKHGAYHVLRGKIPHVTLTAPDGSILFNLMGGPALIDHTRPESVHIKRDGMKGLVPPWKTIDQKGATEDGIHFVDALYDPCEVTLDLVALGRDETHLQQVVRDLIGSADAKQTSELSFFLPKVGRWWADLRWFKTMPNAMSGARRRKQPVTLVLRGDNAFWRSYDHNDLFAFAHEDMLDEFSLAQADGAGPNWPLRYTGSGGGHVVVSRGQVGWHDDSAHLFGPHSRNVVCGPYKNFSTATDNQVVSTQFGSFQEVTFPDGAENHLWARMGRNPDGSWNGYGVRASRSWLGIELSRFNNFVEHRMKLVAPLFPALPNDKYTLIAGVEGNPRKFQVLRNGLPVLTHTESANGLSPLGPAYRGVGFGMRAAAAIITQATPARMRRVSAGDNKTVSQSGFLRRVNIGDQPMFDDYILFGPGKFKLYNGPGATDYVEFGPLTESQIVYIITDPRRRSVVDLTYVPPTPQEQDLYNKALAEYTSYAQANNVPPLLQNIESMFGVSMQQGNVYKLMKGRFSDDSAIPAASPGYGPKPYFVKVAIDDGNANSKVIATGTPLRRHPL